MAKDNPLWGVSRIHGELLCLGYQVSERTVARYVPPNTPENRRRLSWRAFLRSHRDSICAMDFFTVPSATFKQLYGFAILDHGRRKILHVSAVARPSAAWVIQQLREAFPGETEFRYLIHDNDSIFGPDVTKAAREIGLIPIATQKRSPWQNAYMERWIGTCRRELLNHVIVFTAIQLGRLLREYAVYYNEDRTHRSLGKGVPAGCRKFAKVVGDDEKLRIVRQLRVSGLHHRYDLLRVA